MRLDTYSKTFRNIALEREGGVLDVRVHTDGGPLKWGVDPGSVHEQLSEAFYRIGRDPENRVIILRGTGDKFCAERNPAEYTDVTSDEAKYRLIREGRDILANMLEIEVPIISIVNGPATIHPEIPAMADIVLASPQACFQDSHIPAGMVPGDGGQIFWSAVLGPTRASYFFFTEETMDVEEAKRLGVVHEILPADRLLPRAREVANKLAAKSIFVLRYSRMALQQAMKERFAKEMPMGFAAEMLAQSSTSGAHVDFSAKKAGQ